MPSQPTSFANAHPQRANRAFAEAVAGSGVVTLDDHDGHPSIRSLVADDYEILTF